MILLAHWNNSPRIDMSPHADTLSWFRVNPSLLFLLNAAFTDMEKFRVYNESPTTTMNKLLLIGRDRKLSFAGKEGDILQTPSVWQVAHLIRTAQLTDSLFDGGVDVHGTSEKAALFFPMVPSEVCCLLFPSFASDKWCNIIPTCFTKGVWRKNTMESLCCCHGNNR